MTNDQMREALRARIASEALAAMLGNDCKDDKTRGRKGVPILAGYAVEYADALLSALASRSTHPAAGGGVPEGWKLVPIEPPDLMLNSFLHGYGARGGSFNAMHLRQRARSGYAEMLASVPLCFERGILAPPPPEPAR